MSQLMEFDGKKSANPSDFGSALVLPHWKLVPLVTDGSVFPTCRAFFADAAGHANITDAAGNDLVAFPIAAGENKIMIQKISALSGVAHVWGSY